MINKNEKKSEYHQALQHTSRGREVGWRKMSMPNPENEWPRFQSGWGSNFRTDCLLMFADRAHFRVDFC
jgi:hypothetical protein